MSDRNTRLAELGFPLENIIEPSGLYTPVIIYGNTIVTSGCIPLDVKELKYTGKVASQVDIEDAKKAAALCAANALRLIRQQIGSLEKIDRIIKMTGFVNSDSDFTDQHVVMNGASQLLIDVFGDAGKSTRSAVGVSQLPLNSTVEVELTATLK